jgi:hypothetical protein
MTAKWVKSAIGATLDERHFDPEYRIAGRAVDVLKPDGTLLLALRPGSVPWAARDEPTWDALLRAAKPTNYRTTAAGGAEQLFSGAVGYLHGEPRAFTRDDPGWRDVLPLLRFLDRAFREECPEQYAVLREAAEQAGRRGFIRDTSFTTATVNHWSPQHNARMAVHADSGNLPGGYAAMTVLRAGEYEGGLLVIPKYRVAVDLRDGDVLIVDNHEAHGNTDIVGEEYERVSVVAYVHDKRTARDGEPGKRKAP